jgi:L,D-transpeptidase ErfK/SrfK
MKQFTVGEKATVTRTGSKRQSAALRAWWLLAVGRCLGGMLMVGVSLATQAEGYPLPPEGEAVIGEPAEVVAGHDDTLIDLARRHGLGFEEIVNANRGVDPWLPGEGTRIQLPKQRILPDTPREGIVVNLPEHRLYYYPVPKVPEPPSVITYPVSVGKMDWATPLGLTRIALKVRNPTWTPPESVRQEHLKNGEVLPKVVPAGPDNPLGLFAMRLAIPGGAYMIHGTNKPAGVGMQVTHGCMRLYPEDIEALFAMVSEGTPVRIVNQPHKVGWRGGRLYSEAHPALESTDARILAPDLQSLLGLVAQQAVLQSATVEWLETEAVYAAASGMATVVAQRTVELDGT